MRKKKKQTAVDTGPAKPFRNRVIERRRMLGSELTPNALNFRTHPKEQSAALRGVLEEIGQAGELLAYRSERAGGAIVLVDGHLRANDFADQLWDVALTDLTDDEADKLLAVHDPLAAMAGVDVAKLDELLGAVDTDSEGLQLLLDGLAKESGIEQPGNEKEKEDDEGVELRTEFSVIVKCANEADQKQVLEELDRHGLETKALVCGFPVVEKKAVELKPVEIMGREITRHSEIVRTGRVLQLEGIFDVPPAKRSEQSWKVNLTLDRPWQIGLVVGPSGSGKSTIIRELFGEHISSGWEWPVDKAVVDGFPEGMSIIEITGLLSSVGFSSPPSWLKPFGVLSNGEQFRVNLARTLAESDGMSVIDEFTSVVDRTVAQIGSAAVAKAIRSSGRQLIAASCHYDIEEWLQPDWKLEMPACKLTWRSLRQRPEIQIQIQRVGSEAWEGFRQHHYLSHNLHKAAACFQANVNGRPAAFASAIYFPHPTGGHWREHRTVCLPDFQGVGIGNALSEYVASMFAAKGVYRSTTTHPGMIRHRLKSPAWFCTRTPSLVDAPKKHGRKTGVAMTHAVYRLTSSFEYIGPSRPEDASKFGITK